MSVISGDGAHAHDPELARLLERARTMHPRVIDLSLGRLTTLLEKLENPHRALPPVVHVAGTNGKGSTAAFLRAAIEAAGLRVHVYSSPHLVRFNERIRLAGRLIDDTALTALLDEVMGVNDGASITFFELTTAAAFLAFARTPADAAIVEVGLGGRFDATNVMPEPAVCGIAQIGVDHRKFLGDDILGIAAEKAGIAKRGIGLVTARYPAAVAARVAEVAGVAGAHVYPRKTDWDIGTYRGKLYYRDSFGRLELARPRLRGAHQIDNAGLATALLRHQRAIALPEAALRAGPGWAEWPARLQQLTEGPLHRILPQGSELWLDGGHNPAAGRALAEAFRQTHREVRPLHIVCGMIEGKDARGFLKPLSARATSLYAVPVPGHLAYMPETIAETADNIGLPGQVAENVTEALRMIARAADPARPPAVLICGSLYLAGEVLALSGRMPA